MHCSGHVGPETLMHSASSWPHDSLSLVFITHVNKKDSDNLLGNTKSYILYTHNELCSYSIQL